MSCSLCTISRVLTSIILHSNPIELFATCAAHLEPLLDEELAALGYQQRRIGFRGVHIDQAPWEAVYHLNYHSRIASRILMPMARFECRGEQDLYEAIQQVDWVPYFSKGETFIVDVVGHHPKLRHTLFAAQKVKDSICDQLRAKTGKRPNIDLLRPSICIHLFLEERRATLSMDTSGAPLHQRGYRQEGGKAPLRETLAAALIRAAQYQPHERLIDPCTGSGTLLIEAAMVAARMPPGYFRRDWGFLRLPQYNAAVWEQIRQDSDDKRQPLPKDHFLGIECNRHAHRVALTHMRACGFHPAVQLIVGDFRTVTLPWKPTMLIANPPYGERLEEAQLLVPLYRALGDFMKQQLIEGGRGYILAGSLELAKEIGLAAHRRMVLDNGGIEVRLCSFDIR